ncbi:MAG: hypothetical protein Q7S96_03890 [bacterium]|nr:hypothetical protein [bacterium]
MEEYQPGGNNISGRQLTIGLWYLRHKDQLRKAHVLALLVFCVVTWGYVIFGTIQYGFLEYLSFERHWMELTTPQNPRYGLVRRAWAKPITIAEVILLPAGEARYDVAARVVNSNPRIVATIAYEFAVAGAAPETVRTVLLPGRERWLTRSGIESFAHPQRATLTFTATQWDRIGHREMRDVTSFMDERLHVTTARAEFRSGAALQLGAPGTAGTLGRAEITVVNESAFGLRDLELIVLARRRGAIVGVRRVLLSALPAGTARTVAASWFHALGLVETIEAHPFVDVFDPESFVSF